MNICRIVSKIRNEGVIQAAKSVGRFIHGSIFTTDWDMQVIPNLLESFLKEKKNLVLVEIGANTGDTENDHICNFIKKHCRSKMSDDEPGRKVILIEPVTHLYKQLLENVADCVGVKCLNIAIAEKSGTKLFYRYREGLDLEAIGLPHFAHQLGSFSKELFSEICKPYAGAQSLTAFMEQYTICQEIPCMSFEEVSAQESLGVIDMLLIDTEGYDFEILRTIDLNTAAPRYICYERIHLKKDEARCRRYMIENGYALRDHNQDTLCTLGQKVGWFKNLKERAYNRWLEAIY